MNNLMIVARNLYKEVKSSIIEHLRQDKLLKKIQYHQLIKEYTKIRLLKEKYYKKFCPEWGPDDFHRAFSAKCCQLEDASMSVPDKLTKAKQYTQEITNKITELSK